MVMCRNFERERERKREDLLRMMGGRILFLLFLLRVLALQLRDVSQRHPYRDTHNCHTHTHTHRERERERTERYKQREKIME
jgi:hypothetical protein